MTARGTPERPKCRGTTAKGDPCRNRAAAGSAYCSAHGGGKRPPGRPTKLTRDLITTIVDEVANGAYYAQAAEAAGIHRDTLGAWRTTGEEDLDAGRDTLFAALVSELTRATAEAELLMVRTIRGHAPLDWRAAAWYLERRAPDRWGRRDKVSVDGEVRSRPRDVTPEGPARDTILELLAAATRPPAGAET